MVLALAVPTGGQTRVKLRVKLGSNSVSLNDTISMTKFLPSTTFTIFIFISFFYFHIYQGYKNTSFY